MGMLLYDMKAFLNKNIAGFLDAAGFDYYIVDENLLRIVGTGTYKRFVGFNLPLGSATEYVMRTKEVFSIQTSFGHAICEECPARCACQGESMIIHPIVLEGRAIGALAIGAFTDEKKVQFKDDYKRLLELLGNVSELISSKANEVVLQLRMKRMLDNLSEGVVLTDSKGDVIACGEAIKEMFLVGNNPIGHINDLIPEYDLQKIINSGEMHKNGEFTLCITYVDRKIYMRMKPVDGERIKSDILFMFKTDTGAREGNGDAVLDLAQSSGRINDIMGSSSQISRVKNMTISASRHDSNVLIRGESGTGKELFARAIHQLSLRNKGPFVAVNCAAIPEHLLESELFGYESGAFTGANKTGKIGKFEMANKGTLFLDEIGDMAVHLQPKLLRAIEYGQIEKVGGTASLNLNIRIVAATNRNLEELVASGNFREDLYYRLNVIPIFVPPLRGRREDILILARFFADKFCKKFSKKITEFAELVERELLLYDWPGNVRELENTMEYAVLNEATNRLEFSSLPAKFRDRLIQVPKEESLLNRKQMEQNLLSALVEKHGLTVRGKTKIAEDAGMSMSTLYRRLREMNLV